MTRQIVLDTETTGLEPKQGHRIIEIGAIELVNRRITDQRLHFYLNPDREVDEGALAVHGLSNEFLADKPRFTQVLEEFLGFIDGAELIIHNAAFDIGFLNHELNLANARVRSVNKICQIFDTLQLARQLHPGQKNSLDALCKRYSIDNTHRKLHGALLDADILARVYLAMTGGQSTLFDTDVVVQDEVTVEMAADGVYAKSAITDVGHIITADAHESQAHEALLALLRKKNNGSCLWD